MAITELKKEYNKHSKDKCDFITWLRICLDTQEKNLISLYNKENEKSLYHLYKTDNLRKEKEKNIKKTITVIKKYIGVSND